MLFKKKEKKEDKKVVEVSKTSVVNNASQNVFKDISSVLKKPRITEKATDSQEHNVYVFEIKPNSNKSTVSESFFQIYKIKPKKINIVNIPKKSVTVRGRKGFKVGLKKAYIYLKEGDKIDVL